MANILHSGGNLRKVSRRVRDRDFLIEFGKKVREFRKDKGLSQYQFSYETDISRNQIMRIEKGEVNTSIDTISIFSKILQIHPKEFFNF